LDNKAVVKYYVTINHVWWLTNQHLIDVCSQCSLHSTYNTRSARRCPETYVVKRELRLKGEACVGGADITAELSSQRALKSRESP
jgi:hypothetical protein